MKNLFNFCICWLLLLVGVTACQDDGGDLASIPIEPDFVALTSDGTELQNDNDAVGNSYNIFYVGEVITFQNRSTGTPQSVKWVLSNGTFHKTVIADDKGVGVYALMIAGDYSITMYADDEELIYTNYLQVVGGGAPGAVVVDADFTATSGGVELTQEDDALNPIISGAAITLNDTSESAGNYESVKWVFTNAADATISYEAEAAQGKSVDIAIPTAGTFNVTMYASASELTYTNYIKVTKEANLLKGAGFDGSFESESSNLVNFKWGGNFLDTPDVAELSSDQKVSGSQSACIEVAGGKAMIFGLGAKGENKVAIENGKTYIVSFSYYVADVADALGAGEYWPSIGFEFYDNAAEWGWAWKGVTYVDNPTVRLNTWTKASIEIASEVATGTTDLMMRVSNAGTSANLKIYVDDIVLTEVGGDEGGDQGGDQGGTTTPPAPSGENLLSKAGYECGFNDSSKYSWLLQDWMTTWGGFVAPSHSTAQAHTGSGSSYVEIPAGKGLLAALRGATTADMFNISGINAGESYTLEFYAYVPSANNNGAGGIDMVCLFEGQPNAATWGQKISLTSIAKDTWVKVSVAMKAEDSAGATSILLVSNNTEGTSTNSFYIDDMALYSNNPSSGGDEGGTTVTPTPSGSDLFSAAGLDGTFEDMSNLKFANLGIYWDPTLYNSYTFDVAQSSAQKKGGSNSLCFNVKAGEGLIGTFRDGANLTFPVALAANTTYYVSFDMYVESVAAEASANISFDLGAGTYAVTAQKSFYGEATGSWSKVTLPVTTGSVVSGKELIVLVTNGSGAPLKFYVDNMTLSGSSTGGSTGGGTTVTPTPSGNDMFSPAGLNGTFEDMSNLKFANLGIYWDPTLYNPYTFDVAQSSAQKKSGSNSLCFNVKASEGLIGTFRDGGNLTFPVALAANTTYYISFDMYVESVAAEASANISFDLGAGTYAATAQKSFYGEATGTWSKVTLPVTTGSVVSGKELIVLVTNGSGAPLKFYIDNMTLSGSSAGGSTGGSTGGGTTVTPSGSDLLSASGYDTGFENSSKFSWQEQTWMTTWGGFVTPSYSTAQSHTGSGSSYVAIPAGKGLLAALRGSTTAEMFNINGVTLGKSYTLEFYAYVPSANNNGAGGIDMICLFEGQPNTATWGQKLSLTSITKDTWVKVSVVMKPENGDGATSILLVSNNTEGTTSSNFYIDDMKLTEN